MINCNERQRLWRALHEAKASLNKEQEKERLIMVPGGRSSRQAELTNAASETEEHARSAYVEHIRVHQCLM